MAKITITSELRNLEKVQLRCIRFSNYLEQNYSGQYEDLLMRLASLVGTIEDVLNFDN